MPKILEYPRASLMNSLALAKAVGELGGGATKAMAAEKMNLKISGAFSALIGAAGKYGLVDNARGQLATTPLFKEYRHAYTEEEAARVLKKVFLGVPLFQKIYDRFHDTKLPVEILDKILIREFGVEESVASRVSGYLIDAARMAALLKDDNYFVRDGHDVIGDASAPPQNNSMPAVTSLNPDAVAVSVQQKTIERAPDEYVVHFKGPGIDSEVRVLDEDDLIIVQAILNKVKRNLGRFSDEIAPDL